MTSLSNVIKKARRRLLDLHYQSKSGHMGGNFSCVDCLVVLFQSVLSANDSFLLSKGHSAGALYVALWSTGAIDEETLLTFGRDNTKLGAHTPINAYAAIPFGTGSLGHGPSLAAGLALGKKLRNAPGTVYCLCSDGEWQEGACWEALIFAVHQELDNLCLLVDCNGWQAFGSTEEVASLNLAGLRERFVSFGLEVQECDGHDPGEMTRMLAEPCLPKRPRALLLNTCKGKGLAFCENTLTSHYLTLSQEQYLACRRCFDE